MGLGRIELPNPLLPKAFSYLILFTKNAFARCKHYYPFSNILR